MKLMICGHARHGKDTVAGLIRKHKGLSFQDSSFACCEIFIFDKLQMKYGYVTHQECYNDRANHRAEWFELIKEYNTPDSTRLARQIYRRSDMYVGARDDAGFFEARNEGLFDLSIWVDRSLVLPPEDKTSNKIESWMCDVVIENNQGLADLEKKVERLCGALK